MSLRVLSLGFVTPIATLLLFSTAQAQLQRYGNQAVQQQQMQQMQQLQPVKSVGKLVSANPNQIQLTNGAGQTVDVMIGEDTEVSVTGKADPDYLKSGVTVEFLAEVAKGGTVKEKITHLSVVTPTDRPIGLLSADTFALDQKKAGKEDEEKADPVAPDNVAAKASPAKAAPAKGSKSGKNDDLFGSTPAAKTTNAAKSGSLPQLPGTFTVRGTIKLSKSGSITLGVGRGPTIKADLADGATIDVDMSDVRIAQVDDKVTVNGFATQVQPNVVMAKSIEIALANPLSGVKKRVARPAAKTPATGKTPPAKKE